MIMTKILVVDDEEGILDLLNDALSEHGFDVILANDGASALLQVYRERPDIVLLDLIIPGVNGYEVLRELRSEPITKDLPVIMLTAVPPGEGQQIAVQLGVNHYVSKPWKIASLEAIIKVALRDALREAEGWARPTASNFRDVRQFRVDRTISASGWRPENLRRLTVFSS